MPVFEDDDNHIPELPPSVTPKELDYRGITNDLNMRRQATLSTHIRGSRWVVDAYYSQILGADMEPRALQASTLEIHQQYKCIRKVEFKVVGAIPNTPTLDVNSQEQESRGQLNVYPNSVMPVLNDHFTARLPDGRMGLFMICAAPEVSSTFELTGYKAEFILLRWLTRDDQENLRRKTQETYHFVRDRIGTGVNPIITVDEYAEWEHLNAWRNRIPELYLSRFYNKEYATLTVPDQQATTYDPFHAYFVQALFGSQLCGVQNGLNHIPVMDGRAHNIMTLWDMLLVMDAHMLNQLEPQIPVISSANFLGNPYLRGIRYSGMRKVVYPANPQWSDPSSFGYLPCDGESKLDPSPARAVRYRSTLEQLFSNPDLGEPYLYRPKPTLDIRPVLYDDFYVLSEHFYSHDTSSLSVLEKIVWDALETSYVLPSDLLSLIHESESWPYLEQFYYMPILYALIPAATRGI